MLPSTLFTILCTLSALLGVGVLIHLRRTPRSLTCPHCAYSRRDLATDSPCPECGLIPSAARGRARKRRVPLFIAALLAILVLPAWLIWPSPFRQAWWLIRYKTWVRDHESTYDDWRIVYLKGGRPDNESFASRAQLWWKSSLVFDSLTPRSEGEGGDFFRGNLKTDPLDPTTLLHVDLTDDGIPEIFLSEYTGGAHCCFVLHVFTEADPPRLLASVEGLDSDVTVLRPSENRPAHLTLSDWTFRYWNASFAESPAPELSLVWNGIAFEPSAELSRTPVPTASIEGLAAAAVGTSLSHVPDKWPQPAFWDTMLDLMYGGHEALAWRVFDRASVGHESQAATFKREFLEQLSKSPYWPALKAGYDAESPAAPDR
ncbi:MAG: hypothetical protein U0638_08350 [Phycisphaerales bacterium]